ncbi:MAG TPA: FAD-binding oxidoreductase [Streptosporangiaceae bacterium]|nr:FAD-binding oxidoreductase [Streptosporangiaceae bacterium]
MSADVVIVGAGVIGAATAFHLSLLGAGDVLVLDRATVGSGMSCRSSALVRMHYTFGPEVELAVRSDAMFGAWPDLTGRPGCVRRTGFVRIVSPGEEAALRANVAMQRALGARAEVIDAAGLKEVAPGLRADDVECAAWEPNGGYGDGAVVAGDLLAAARARGVRYRPHSPVAALLTDGGRVTGVELAGSGSGTGGGDREHAGTVVLAAGVWSPALLRTAGVVLPIETELHRVAVLAHGEGRGAPVACIDSTTQTYFRPEAGGSMTLVGAFAGQRGADPDAVASAAGEDLAPLVQAASHRVPALEDAGIVRGVTGVYDMTPDARPLLGRLPGLDGLIVAAGFSGMGFKISPAVGEGIAGLIAGAPAGSVDLAPFRPDRLSDGRPIEPPDPYSDD